MKTLRNFLLFLVIFGLVLIGAVRWNAESEQKMRPVQGISGEMKRPGDLTGDWTTKDDAKIKFVAEIHSGTILIHTHFQGTTMAYYYGTWPAAGNDNVFRSAKIVDPDPAKSAVSSSTNKDFLWQDDQLIFDFQVGPVTTAIVLVKEK